MLAHMILIFRAQGASEGRKIITSKSDDTINRQAAIDALNASMIFGRCNEKTVTFKALKKYAEGVRERIEALPSAQPGWIPWNSGRFPEESGTYTVTAYDGATKRVTYAKYQKRLKRWELTGARAYWRVLAWMPSLEPWEGEQNG